ncbi:MAG: hypothetical protein RLZ22_1388, partial [Verrucomicrobiota bacterium]
SRALLLLKKNRQSADMIKMRVGDDDAIDAVLFDKVVVRDGLERFMLRVHAGIEHDA